MTRKKQEPVEQPAPTPLLGSGFGRVDVAAGWQPVEEDDQSQGSTQSSSLTDHRSG